MYQQCTNPMIPSLSSRKRRRRTIATSCLSIATLLLTTSTLLVVESTTTTNDEATTNDDEQQQTYSNEEMTNHHTNNHYTTITKWKERSLSSSLTSSSLSSNTSSSTTSTFNYSKIRPLDLVIDNTDTNKHSPRVYQVGIYGQLEPYNEINYESYVGFVDLSLFTTSSSVGAHVEVNAGGSGEANNSSEEASSDNDTKTTREGVITHNKKPIGKYTRPAFRTNDNDSHSQSKRLGMSNFDKRRGIGIDEGEEREEEEAVERRKERELITRGLRGGVDDENVEESKESLDVEGKAVLFPYTAENDPWELEEDELYEINEGRLLSSANAFASHHGKKSSSHADNFQNSHILPSKEKGGTSSKLQQKVSQAPIISSTFPPPDVHIGKHQTFGATVYGVDNGVEQRSINAKVCVQFQDAHGGRSTCFDLDRVGHKGDGKAVDRRDRRELLNCAKKKHKDHPRCKNKQDQGEEDTDGSINLGGGEQQQVQQDEAIIHEKIFEGFQAFPGQRWKFRIRAVNKDKVRVMSQWHKFTISEYLGQMPEEEEEEIEESTTSSTAAPPPEEEEEVESAPPAPPTKLLKEVRDENWPHGGIVQTSTGRIMFFFDDNPYVCSGTVLEDSQKDRTIILTAGHCAYQWRDIGGRFAQHALFIPNQVDTRGEVSDDICTNDPLGCWTTAFAVVDYEWTTKNFPQSVPWDYAMYVIPNDPAAHEGGFIHKTQPNLSKILEEIVEPMPIDFEWQLPPSSVHDIQPGEFTHGLGYSFNKDPAFRYCATEMTSKFGIKSYENLWLDSCEMTGGSSGGPWLKDTDTDGRGTVISINSWGYASSHGMAGPNFNTATGSKVECLFEVAKNARFEDMVGQRGIAVANC